MNREFLSRVVGGIDEEYIDEAAVPGGGREARRPAKKRLWGALAACLALLLLAGGVTAAVAESRTYANAVTFFEQNGLSAQGLTRAQIRAVYRDITTKRFTYEKTAEVITNAVPGWQIEQPEPTPEELAALWDRNVWARTLPGTGVGYQFRYVETMNGSLGFETLEKSVVECYRDGALMWTAEFPAFYAEKAAYTSVGTAVWGWNPTWQSGQEQYAYVACVDDTGAVRWQSRLYHHLQYEYISAVLDNGDGTLAVISRGHGEDKNWLCLSKYDGNGGETLFAKTQIGNLGVLGAARLGEGYIVHVGGALSGETSLIYRLSKDGVFTQSFRYESEDRDYYITDMIEFGSHVYLSAYAVPKQTDEGGRHEIGNILSYVFQKYKDGGVFDISGEELTPLLRQNYTAVLLLCDPAGGEPKTFFEAEGSLGADLALTEAGELTWDVHSIVSSFFSPATDSFTIGGMCSVFRYTFNASGVLLGRTDTGETAPYRR